MTDDIRVRLTELLETTGEFVHRADSATSPEEAKHWIRRAHESQRQDRLRAARTFIEQYEDDLLPLFANGTDIDPTHIEPVISPAITERDLNLWRYASLTWSVPISQGYGRRTKFIVRDRHNHKVIAIFALGDPVIALGVRDTAIGWNQQQRHKRLYNVFDAFVLGAVEPYRQLLGGKLVALLSTSNETRQFLAHKYSNTTPMRGERKDPTPVLVTTSSALGRSSVYNRLTYYEQKAFVPVGYTSGFGHFHISEETFQDLVDLLRVSNKEQSGQYGAGANYRFRVIRSALKVLGLPADGLRHGVRREVYLAPLAENWKEYLRGETNDIQSFDRPADDIAEYYRTRWAIPRALRQTNFTNWRKDAMRLSHQLPNTQIQFSLSSAFDVAKFVKEITTNAWNVAGVTAVAHPIVADITGESVSGVLGAGRAHVTSITFQNIQVEVADTTWSTGERDIQAIDRKDSPPTVDSLIRRLRIGIHNTPELENLVFAELRVALPDDQGRAVVRKLSQNKIEALLNLKLTEVLPAKRNVVVGTREELLGDSSRRRTELCALFPRDDQRTPIDIWILTRLLPFLLLSGPKMIENVPTQKVAAGPQGQAGQAGRSRRRSSRPASQGRRQTRKPK